MAPPQAKLVLWVGPKHSGKTTAAAELVRRARAGGFRVAGVLAPALHRGGELSGFDLVDASTGERAPLARREGAGSLRAGSFVFCADGIERGHAALMSGTARSADLVMVDEFGVLECRGEGWRRAVDDLLASASGTIVLVVRERLAERVGRLYASRRPQALPASEPSSVDSVLALLGERGASAEEGTR